MVDDWLGEWFGGWLGGWLYFLILRLCLVSGPVLFPENGEAVDFDLEAVVFLFASLGRLL